MSPIGEGYNRAKIAQKVRFNGSAGSSFAGSTTPTISSALSSLPASSSSSNDFEIGSSQFSPIHLTDTLAQTRIGVASVYSTESGSKTASGQKLNPAALTAAHRSLPLGSKVTVTNKSNGRSVVVTINDRGPFVRGRVIDVSPTAARALGFSGLTQVSVRTGD